MLGRHAQLKGAVTCSSLAIRSGSSPASRALGLDLALGVAIIAECRPSDQVIPRAALTDLDDVGNVGASSLRQTRQLTAQADTSAVLRKPGPKDIGHVHELRCFADGTGAWRWRTNLTGGALELWMRVAHLGAVDEPGAVLAQPGRAGKPVIDMALGGASARRYSKHDASIVEPDRKVVHM